MLVIPVGGDVAHNEERVRSGEKTESRSQGCRECHTHEISKKRGRRARDTSRGSWEEGIHVAVTWHGRTRTPTDACLERERERERDKTTYAPEGAGEVKQESPDSLSHKEVKGTSEKTARSKGSGFAEPECKKLVRKRRDGREQIERVSATVWG